MEYLIYPLLDNPYVGQKIFNVQKGLDYLVFLWKLTSLVQAMLVWRQEVSLFSWFLFILSATIL